MQIYRLSQSPYYRIDGALAPANTGGFKEGLQVKSKPAKKMAEEKKPWPEDEDSGIVIYA